MEAQDEIAEALRRFFGHADFRAGQRGPVEAVLAGRDAVARNLTTFRRDNLDKRPYFPRKNAG